MNDLLHSSHSFDNEENGPLKHIGQECNLSNHLHIMVSIMNYIYEKLNLHRRCCYVVIFFSKITEFPDCGKLMIFESVKSIQRVINGVFLEVKKGFHKLRLPMQL